MQDKRRRASRHFFTAEAELIEPQTEVRATTRVRDLSLYGCYLDMMNPDPADTLLKLRIRARGEVFESNSRIVYAIPSGRRVPGCRVEWPGRPCALVGGSGWSRRYSPARVLEKPVGHHCVSV